MARTLNRNLKTLTDYFYKGSIQTAILWEMSIALKHNFFADIAVQLPDTFESPIQQMKAAKDVEIATLQQQIERLKADKDLLLQVARK